MALTDTFVKRVKHSGKAAGDKYTDGGAMFLQVNEAGKYWRMDYKFGSKRKTLALGVYPAVSLADARKRRDKAREQLAAGIDPNAAKKVEKAAMMTANESTLRVIGLEWLATKEGGWSSSHAETTLERMEKNLFPWLGNRPLTDIEAPEILVTLRRIEARGAIDTTHRVKSILDNIFRYAIATGRATRNPAADVGVALKTTVKGHHPAITDAERFGQLLRDIETYTGSYITRAALKISALAFQRPPCVRLVVAALF